MKSQSNEKLRFHYGITEEVIASWGSELLKCAQPSSTVKMEVEALVVGGGNCLKEVFRNSFIQKRM